VANEKLEPQGRRGQPPEPDSAASGEYVRHASGDREPFRTESATRRALNASPTQAEPQPQAAQAPQLRRPTRQDEEQTLRSAKVPQRIRMSLRMRRVAAAASGAASADDAPARLCAGDRVGLRLAGRVFDLNLGEQAIAGRSAECEIVLGDRLCSRRHAAFSRTEDGGALVQDLGSSNGCYVNGVRISTPQRLARGDWITIGNETLELCVSAPVQGAQTPTIPVGPKRETAPRASGRSTAKTDPGSPLLALASFAATAAGRTPTPLPADVVRKPLDALLLRLDLGQTIAESDAQMAASVALHLARTSQDSAWLDYVFRLYSALRLPLSAQLIERLRETLAGLQFAETMAFRSYVEMLQRSEPDAWDDSQRQLIARLLELDRWSDDPARG